MKWGLLIVGNNGANAQAVRAAITAFRKGRLHEKYGLSSAPWISQTTLPNAMDTVISGWDVRGAVHQDLAPDATCEGILSEADTLLGDEAAHLKAASVGAEVDRLASQIAQFGTTHGLENLTVINCATPSARVGSDVLGEGLDGLYRRNLAELPSSVTYALASIRAGAAYIDFTPSQTLELPAVVEYSRKLDVPVAGRDGATGQTFLKALIASALEARGLRPVMWYSTNILGNRDGLALASAAAAETKMMDKAWALGEITGIDRSQHQIDIRYVEALGDIKEAWDSVVLEGFMGSKVELRLNWRGLDSPLAAQMVLDLYRLMAASRSRREGGMNTDLSFFFKRPLGVRAASPITYLSHFVRSNPGLLEGEIEEVLAGL